MKTAVYFNKNTTRCFLKITLLLDLVGSSASQFIHSDLQRLERAADQRMGQASHFCAAIWEITVI